MWKYSLILTLLVGANESLAKTWDNMILVPAQQPFYINIFEVSAKNCRDAGVATPYSADVKSTRFKTLAEAQNYCRRRGKRVATTEQWMAAASNLGQNKNYTLKGDTINRSGGGWAAHIKAGDSVSYNDIGVLGIDAIGTVGLTGNRAEWVVDKSGQPTMCGGAYSGLEPTDYKLGGLCGRQGSVVWRDRGANVRCVVDFNPNDTVRLLSDVSQQLRNHIQQVSRSYANGVNHNGFGKITIPKPKNPKNPNNRLGKPEPHYDSEF